MLWAKAMLMSEQDFQKNLYIIRIIKALLVPQGNLMKFGYIIKIIKAPL